MFLADYAVYLHPKLLIVKVISFSLPKRKDLINVTHCISYFCKATRLSNHRSQKHLQSTDIILEVVQSIIPCNPIIIIIAARTPASSLIHRHCSCSREARNAKGVATAAAGRSLVPDPVLAPMYSPGRGGALQYSSMSSQSNR